MLDLSWIESDFLRLDFDYRKTIVFMQTEKGEEPKVRNLPAIDDKFSKMNHVEKSSVKHNKNTLPWGML